MARNLSAQEAKAENVATMGEIVGPVYDVLWQQLAAAYIQWNEFIELFGTNEDRIELLNSSAAHFFRIVQDSLWERTLLILTKMTHPAEMGAKSNLTIQRLLHIVDRDLARQLAPLVTHALDRTTFARDWRNRHITHTDLALALDGEATPLAPASRIDVDNALSALADVLNSVSSFYKGGSTTMFKGVGPGPGGGVSLLYVIRDGLEAEEGRLRRLMQGTPLPEDLTRRRGV